MTTSGLFVDNLPLTFRHAITAVNRLGLEYIWINILCIIQLIQKIGLNSQLPWQKSVDIPKLVSQYQRRQIPIEGSFETKNAQASMVPGQI